MNAKATASDQEVEVDTTAHNKFLSGDGRLCRPRGREGSEGPAQAGQAGPLLPVCLDGKHRLLPPLSRMDVKELKSIAMQAGHDLQPPSLPGFIDIANYPNTDATVDGAARAIRVSPLNSVGHWLQLLETLLLRVVLVAVAVVTFLYFLDHWGVALPKLMLEILERGLAVGALSGLAIGRSRPSATSLAMGTTSSLSPVPVVSAPLVDSGMSVQFDEHGNKVTKIGSLMLTSLVLGYGSHGTVVLKGSLNGRPVAVKRMLTQFSRAAER